MMQVSSASASMASEAEMVVGEAGGGGGGDRKRKKTLGRRKIEIKPIGGIEARHVCFSKRREGIYKKATELCALTGAKVAIVVFSPAPAGKPYSYGHPSVHAVVDRYLGDDDHQLDPGSGSGSGSSSSSSFAGAASASDAFEAPPPPLMYEFDGQCERLREALAAEARRKDALDAAARAAGVWTDDVVRKAGIPDLVAMLAALERVKDDADHAMRQQCAAAAAADACYYDLGDGTTFAADDYGGGASGSSHHQQQAATMDAQTMALLMGSNVVGHGAAAHAPMLLPPPPPDLPTMMAAPVPLAFNYYGSDHTQITGYEGYAYDLGLGDGGGHGAAAAYQPAEGCFFGPTATCNFFG